MPTRLSPPFAFIDFPGNGSTVSGTVTVTGWSIGSVKVLVDNVPKGNAVYGTPRGDLCISYPGRPGCPNVGFTYQLDTETLTVGTHTIMVTATDTANPR